MGSFNTECSFTKQVIQSDIGCMIIPIYQSLSLSDCSLSKSHEKEPFNFRARLSSSTDTAFLWTPLSLQLECEHEDCGLFNLKENDENIKHLTSLFDKLFQLSLKSTDHYDDVFDFKTIYDPKKEYSYDDLNKIFIKIQAEDNFFIEIDYEPCIISFCPILKETFNYLIKFSDTIKRCDNTTINQKQMFTDWFNKKIEEEKTILQTNIFKDLSKEDLDKSFAIFVAISLGHFSEYQTHSYSPILRPSNEENNELSNLLVEFGLDIKSDKIYEFSEIKEFYNLLKPKLDFLNLNRSMLELHLKFLPAYYAGQDYSNDSGNEFLKMVKHVNNVVELNMKENEI